MFEPDRRFSDRLSEFFDVPKTALLLSTLLASLLVLRLVIFCASFGAVEHDSGWYIGLARNLAHHGLYASNLNSISDGDAPGAHHSIFFRVSVQDKEGRIYFPAAVTVGPGMILPLAASILALGDQVWAFRLAPLIACFGLLFLSMIWMARFSGARCWLGPLVLFFWLWMYPQFWFQLSYEAFAEPTALFYWMLAAIFFARARYVASGFFMGLAIETKLLALLGFAAFLAVGARRLMLRDWLRFSLATAAPVLAFELYRLIEMTRRFDLEAWKATNTDLLTVLIRNGSGADSATGIESELFAKKLDVWKLIGIRWGALGFALVGSAGAYRALVLRRQSSRGKIHPFFALVFIYVVTHLAWYVFKSPTGWGRHAWPGLFLGMMLISSLVSAGLSHPLRHWDRALVALAVLAFGFHGRHVFAQPIFRHSVVEEWNRIRSAYPIQGFPSSALFELGDQIEVARFIENSISRDAWLHYQETWLVAEMTAFTKRVFYPFSIARLPKDREHYIIFGPYQAQGFYYSFETKEMHDQFFSQYCESQVFQNPSYSICRAK